MVQTTSAFFIHGDVAESRAVFEQDVPVSLSAENATAWNPGGI